jgi:nifR3 family TIM-barrel protein
LAARQKSYQLMAFHEGERPMGVQLFGGDPGVMAEAAADVVRTIHPDLLDVNFGCPVGKILKSDSGAAVLKEPARAGHIVKAMIEATDGKVPVTVKTRAGYDAEDGAVFELLQSVQEAGAAALAVHARTRKQMYSGKADWNLIRRLKEKARIPLLGNGDVRSPQDAARMFLETGCDGILVGRAAMGRPWLFEEIRHYLATGRTLPPKGLKFRMGLAAGQLEASLAAKGPRWGLLEMRKHLVHYLKGFDGARDLRQKLLTSEDPDWVLGSLRKLHAELPEADPVHVELA